MAGDQSRTRQLGDLVAPSLAPDRDVLVGVLKSRTVVERIVEKFDLARHYRSRSMDDAVAALQDATTVVISKEGLVLVTVEHVDAKQAAAIANAHVEELDRVVGSFQRTRSGRLRRFLDAQLQASKTSLATSEDELRRFQERHGTILLPDQTDALISAAAQLSGEIMATEVQMHVLRTFSTDATAEMIAQQRQLEELRRQLNRLQYGKDAAARPRVARAGSEDTIYLPFAQLPALSLEAARLTRDVRTREVAVAMLRAQLDQAALSEENDRQSVQRLDVAVPPARPSKPELLLNVALASATAFFFVIVVAFTLQYLDNLAASRASMAGGR